MIKNINEHSISILFIVFLFACLYKSKIEDKSSFTIDDSKTLKGIFSILIIFHHLSDYQIIDDRINRILSESGTQLTSIFFFISGFGLMKKYINNTISKEKFIINRITKILYPYIIVVLIYWVVFISTGLSYSAKDVLLSIINLTPIVSYSWYIIEILYIYILFYIFIKVFKQKNNLIILSYCISFVIFFLLNENGYSWLHLSTPAFIVGLLFAIYEERIYCFINKHYLCSLTLSLLLYFLSYYYRDLEKYLPFTLENTIWFYVPILLKNVLFSVIIVLVIKKIKINNSFISVISDISFELYIIHGLVIYLMNYFYIFNSHTMLYFVIVFLFSLLFAFLLHKLFRILNKNNII